MRMNSNPAPWILKTEAPSWSPIARLAGHHQTSTTEVVYRRELRPVITPAAGIIDRIFSS